MKKFDQWWMPDDEEHLPDNMRTIARRVDGRLTYQYGKYEAAKVHTKQFRTVFDIGAHIGLWSFFMADDFQNVIGFEPMKRHRECWLKNMEGKENAVCHAVALGEVRNFVSLETRTVGSSGDTQVSSNHGEIKMDRMDDYLRDDIDLIKIDCEGYEEFILRGGINILMLNKPCVIVEQKPGHSDKYGLEKESAVTFLQDLGAKVRKEISGDFILSWG